MPIHAYQSEHVFGENRLYLSNSDESSTKIDIINVKRESIGAGMKSYSLPIGWILSWFKIARAIQVDNKTFYVNNQSFAKYIIRCQKIYYPQFDISIKATMNKLDTEYRKIQSGEHNYDTNLVNDIYQEIVKHKNELTIVKDLLEKHCGDFYSIFRDRVNSR